MAATNYNKYIEEFGTITRMDYKTGITVSHHGKVMGVDGHVITILKLDGSHVSSNVIDFRLDNPAKFLMRF
jgi:predicted aconitase with swiveling domain